MKLRLLYYRLRAAIFRKYQMDDKVDLLVMCLLNKNITRIELLLCNGVRIDYEDGTSIDFLNSSRWQTWMSQGKITWNDGRTNLWEGVSPSAETTYLFDQAIKATLNKRITAGSATFQSPNTLHV